MNLTKLRLSWELGVDQILTHEAHQNFKNNSTFLGFFFHKETHFWTNTSITTHNPQGLGEVIWWMDKRKSVKEWLKKSDKFLLQWGIRSEIPNCHVFKNEHAKLLLRSGGANNNGGGNANTTHRDRCQHIDCPSPHVVCTLVLCPYKCTKVIPFLWSYRPPPQRTME